MFGHVIEWALAQSYTFNGQQAAYGYQYNCPITFVLGITLPPLLSNLELRIFYMLTVGI